MFSGSKGSPGASGPLAYPQFLYGTILFKNFVDIQLLYLNLLMLSYGTFSRDYSSLHSVRQAEAIGQ